MFYISLHSVGGAYRLFAVGSDFLPLVGHHVSQRSDADQASFCLGGDLIATSNVQVFQCGTMFDQVIHALIGDFGTVLQSKGGQTSATLREDFQAAIVYVLTLAEIDNFQRRTVDGELLHSGIRYLEVMKV